MTAQDMPRSTSKTFFCVRSSSLKDEEASTEKEDENATHSPARDEEKSG